MQNIKARLVAIVLILVFGGLTYLTWHELLTTGRYPLKMAAFAPVGIIGGLFLLIFPTRMGKPQTTTDKLVVLLVFGLGLLAGLANWYLMDPGFFRR